MSKKLLANVGNTVVDNYRRYYQEFEGTFITATNKSEDDTLDTSRYIEVTEIWGNTVQDENNLEDIQSIGELYVDEQGQPILDDLGREQYKIEIESCNKNLFNKNVGILENTIINSNGVIGSFNGDFLQDVYIRIKPNTNYTFSTSVVTNKRVAWYDEDKVFINRYSNGTSKFTTKSPSNARYLRYSGSLSNIDEVQIEEGSVKTDFIPNQSHKTTILLPCQLQKVGDVYDRLYWDSEKGKYVVEKNILNEKDLGQLNWIKQPENDTYASFSAVHPSSISNYSIISNKFNEITSSEFSNLSKEGVFRGTSGFGLVIEKIKLVDTSIDSIKEYLSNIGSIIYYASNSPQLIETSITEKIQLPCYEEKTHIFCNSTVDATMKVLVPYKEII